MDGLRGKSRDWQDINKGYESFNYSSWFCGEIQSTTSQ
jgi:hypothetical protein